jgi:hypothetical protein
MQVEPGSRNQSLQVVGTTPTFVPVKKQRTLPPTDLSNRHAGRAFFK